MIVARELSAAERCLRLPGLLAQYEPERWPVREAAKRYFYRGIEQLNTPDAAEYVKTAFLAEAADRGFEYPNVAEPFILANDYASWLEAAILIAQEDQHELVRIPLAYTRGQAINMEAYHDPGGNAHVFRVERAFREYKLRWPELLIAATNAAKEIIVHRFRLPDTTDQGRLASPLSMGYLHPTIGNTIRLARFAADRQQKSKNKTRGFSSSWKRVGRWERPDILWSEWREGLDRDQAMQLVYRPEVLFDDLLPSAIERREILADARHLAAAITGPQPRKRESCESCVMYQMCHGTAEERSLFVQLPAGQATPADPVPAASET